MCVVRVGSRPLRRANSYNKLRTTNLSLDLQVVLFRAHFMRVFLRRLKAPPGCSRVRNHPFVLISLQMDCDLWNEVLTLVALAL